MGLIFYFLNEENVIFADPIPGELDQAISYVATTDFTMVIRGLATLRIIRFTFGLWLGLGVRVRVRVRE
jgi:hypothetical protein